MSPWYFSRRWYTTDTRAEYIKKYGWWNYIFHTSKDMKAFMRENEALRAADEKLRKKNFGKWLTTGPWESQPVFRKVKR